MFFNKVAGLRPATCNTIKKDTLAQMFSCEFGEISKNIFFQRTPPVAPFVCSKRKNHTADTLATMGGKTSFDDHLRLERY